MPKKKQGTPTTVGVDVGFKELVVRIRCANGDSRLVSLPNTPDGHASLMEELHKDGRTARIVMEATGTYHLDLAMFLTRKRGMEVMVINPLASRRFAQAQMRRAKTDKVDAAVLLDFCERMPMASWTPPSEAVLSLRAIARHMCTEIGDKVALENRLIAAKATAFTPSFVLTDLADQISAMEKRIEAAQAAAVEVVRADPTLSAQLDALDSIPGIGIRAGVQLLGELAPLDSQMTPDEVVAHAGLDPRPKQSGGMDSPRHISKVGNARLRAALYMPAMSAARGNSVVQAWYQTLIDRKKPAFVAQVAVMRRLLRVAWVLMGTRGTWDPTKFQPRPSRTQTSATSAAP